MRFMMLMIPKGYGEAAAETRPSADAVAAMMKFNEALREAGVLMALEGLHPLASGTRVVFEGKDVRRVDGPFTGVADAVGGYWMIRVGSKDEAVEWAMKCPVFHDAVIEIRQVMEMEDFPADVQEVAQGFEGMQEG